MSDMTWYYKNLAPHQVDNFKTFYNNLNYANDDEVIDNAQKLNTTNYVTDLLAALRSGLLWSALSQEEKALLAEKCHPSHLVEFIK